MSSLEPLTLAVPAVVGMASLICASPGRLGPRLHAGAGLWVLRIGLLAALAMTTDLLFQLQPSGVLGFAVWRFAQRLPFSLQADTVACVAAMMVTAAALVVTFAGRHRSPLSCSALGVAALGAVLVAFAGGLLTMYVGLQLSLIGGIGLSYARRPRRASLRLLLAAAADQAIALLWLGLLVAVLSQWGTEEFTALPTAAMSPALVVLLVLPALARLSSAALLGDPLRRQTPDERLTAADLGDWLAVVAVPTSAVLLVRIEQLSGGSWPASWIGTGFDALALLLAAGGVLLMVMSRSLRGELAAALLAGACLTLVGFGENSISGTILGCAGALFMELEAVFLPRAWMARYLEPARGADRRTRGPWLLAGSALLLSPISLAYAVAVTGGALALSRGLSAGVGPALGYTAALVLLSLLAPRFWSLGRARLAPALFVPGLALLAASLLPGWTLTLAGGALAGDAAGGGSVITAPDALSVQVGGVLWPGGYFAILLGLALTLLALVWVARDAPRQPGYAGTLPPQLPFGAPLLGRRLRARLALALPAPDLRQAAGRWTQLVSALAQREVAERPVWLWLATAAAVGWMFAELTHL